MRHLFTTTLLALLAVMLMGSGNKPSYGWEYDRFGAAIRHTNPDRKTVHLIFTADSAFEGGEYAMDVLAAHGVKASFFFTGNFMRDTLRNSPIIHRAINEGHYVGSHGDRHILLADWDRDRTTLATADSAVRDMNAAFVELLKYGIPRDSARILIPSFEWYNRTHIEAFHNAGLFPINLTPGIETYKDYTTPDLPYYATSAEIWEQLLSRLSTPGFDGSIILIHLGTDSSRTDKFYRYLPALLDTLASHHYHPEKFYPITTLKCCQSE